MQQGEQSRTSWALPVCVGAAALLIRLPTLNVSLVGWDEWILTHISVRIVTYAVPAGEWYDVLVPTGYSYPGTFFWLNALVIGLTDSAPWAWRLVTLLSEAGCAAMLCVLGRRLDGPITGGLAGGFAAATLYLAYHDAVSIDYLLCFWILVSLCLFLRGLDDPRPWLIVAAVAVASAACFTKYHGVVYLAMMCLLVPAVPASRRMLRPKHWAAAVAAALVLPVTLLLIEGVSWRLYGFEKTHIAEVFRVMEWTSFVTDPETGTVIRPGPFYYFGYTAWALGWALCGTMLAGVALQCRARGRNWMIVLAVMLAWWAWASTSDLKNARYVLPGVYLGLLFAAHALRQLFTMPRYRAVAVVIAAALLTVGLLRTVERTRDYLATAERHDAVRAFIAETVPPEAHVLFERNAFQYAATPEFGWLDVEPLSPESAGAWDLADYAVVDAFAHDLMAAGALRSYEGYLDARDEALATWDVVLDVGEGAERMQVLRAPHGTASD